MDSKNIEMAVNDNTTIIKLGSESTSLSKNEIIYLFNEVLSEYGYLVLSKEHFANMYKAVK